MDDQAKEIFSSLEANIQNIIKVYRALLEVVRKEKEILIAADLDELNDNNATKENLLVKISRLERERAELTVSLAKAIGLKNQDPKMLQLANEIGGKVGDRMRDLHSVLVLLLKRVKDVNEQNEILVKSALENVKGAMNIIKDDLVDQTTYKQKGQIDKQAELSGRLVSREV